MYSIFVPGYSWNGMKKGNLLTKWIALC